MKSKRIPILICLAVTIFVEIAQYYTYRGYFDLDDIIVNLLGGTVGVICSHRFDDRLKNWPVPTILLLAGVIGCVICTGNTVNYETQFGFYIDDVAVESDTIMLSGRCSIYRRRALPYQIQLKGENGTYLAATEVIDDHFIAAATATDSEYEVDVVFQGFPPISTGTYIKDGQAVFVIDFPPPEVIGTDLEFIINGGILKLYNSDYDVYVYQVDDRLYWLIGKDFDASIIYHLYTEETEHLPEDRKQYGFDNRGFKAGSEKDLTDSLNCGKYRVFTDIIPTEYTVSAITVGMNKGPDVLWKEQFRVNQYFNSNRVP